MRAEHWLYTVPLRLRSLFCRQQVEEELEEELQYHIEQKTERYIAQGMDSEQARRAALRDMDGFERHKEECRDMRHVRWIEDLLKDLRFAGRQLRRNPGFTAVAIMTLALGIGANTAIFRVVDGVLLAPLPYRHAERLVVMWESVPRSKYAQTDSYPNFRDWQREAHSFQEMAAWRGGGHDLTSPGLPEHIDGNEISSGFFATLGIKLALGRGFTQQEYQRGGAPVVVISNLLWRKRFNGSPHVLSKVVTLDGIDYSIVGVLPRGFQFFGHPDVYTPLGQGDGGSPNTRAEHVGIGTLGLLRPGVDLTQARAVSARM